MTDIELTECCREWQAVLGMRDWDVAVRYVYAHELEDFHAWGDVAWNLDKKTATIRILHEEARMPEPEWRPLANTELTIIHELCHIPLADWWDAHGEDPLHARAIENAVHQFSRALLSLKRGGATDQHMVTYHSSEVLAGLHRCQAGDAVDTIGLQHFITSEVQKGRE